MVDPSSGVLDDFADTFQRPRRSERHAAGQRAPAQGQGNPPTHIHTHNEYRSRRSATPTPMSPLSPMLLPNPMGGYDPAFHSQNNFQTFTPAPTMQHHQHQHGSGMPPDYYDKMNGAGAGAGVGAGVGAYPQPQASYGGVMGGYPMWNASQRAFPHLPNYGAANSSWYANGFGWGMR